jgi:hypothetical protein
MCENPCVLEAEAQRPMSRLHPLTHHWWEPHPQTARLNKVRYVLPVPHADLALNTYR